MGSFKNVRKRDVAAFCVGGYIGQKLIIAFLSKVLPLK